VRLDGAKRTDSRCLVARAWSSGRPELRGREAAGMEMSGVTAPAVPAGVLSSRRIKPVSSVLAMSTAAASAAMAFSNCERRLGYGMGEGRVCWKLRRANDACERQLSIAVSCKTTTLSRAQWQVQGVLT